MRDVEYFNMETQAYIRIEEGGTGDFQFGLVAGSISGYVEKVSTESRFMFTWEGRDEMDPASGDGRLRLVEKDQSKGMITFHRGDRSNSKPEEPLDASATAQNAVSNQWPMPLATNTRVSLVDAERARMD